MWRKRYLITSWIGEKENKNSVMKDFSDLLSHFWLENRNEKLFVWGESVNQKFNESRKYGIRDTQWNEIKLS